jgi:hypothetical protein
VAVNDLIGSKGREALGPGFVRIRRSASRRPTTEGERWRRRPT